MSSEQVAAQIYGRAAAPSGAEEQRQQFGVRQCRRSTVQQFFARPFFRGPVPDAHDRSLRPPTGSRQPETPRIPVSYRRVDLSVEFLHG